MKRIAIPVFLFFLLAPPCAKSLFCLKQEKESYSQKKDAPTIELDLFKDELGIGVVFKEDNGYYVTQDFIRALAPKGRIEAEAEVEENINWMRRVNSLPAISFLAEANIFAQQYSINKAEDRSPPPIPSHFGETHLFYTRTPSFEYLYSKYKDKLLDKHYETAGLGIDFSRHEKSPGGAYFITLLLLPESEYKSRSNKDLKEIVFNTINNTRENKGLASLIEDKKLSANAEEALKIIFKQMNTTSIGLPKFGRATVIAYVTKNPTLLPEGLKSQLEENFIYYKRIGISIRFEKDSKYPGGAFWVVILIME